MDSLAPPAEMAGKLTGSTRRSFIRGIAAAGASTAAAYALDRSGVASLFPESADAHGGSTFSDFTAIAASPADRLEVPQGFRADVLIAWGDTFADGDGNVLEYGFNNDFLAFFPLGKKGDEGVLFANHEYPSPFFQHGYRADAAGVAAGKSAEDVELERRAVGNSFLHIRQDHRGIWKVVSPSRYNRRIYGGLVDAPQADGSRFAVTGPLKGDPRVGTEIAGSLGNCSGGITPWGTAISCEENFDGYGLPLTVGNEFANGWVEAGFPDYHPGAPYRTTGGTGFAKYGWVCEHDPYDPRVKPRKHTALGRFRHENTAFRARRGSKFVLYMGDDKANEGVYKFVSDRSFKPWDRANNLKILESGTLYIAKWTPEGRRRFTTSGDTVPVTPTSGTGEWVEVLESELVDTATLLRARFGAAEYDLHFATNRPEDVEVQDETGHVFVAFTNNSSVRDVHGAVRRIVEDGNDPEATTFAWDDFANGGQTGRPAPGEQGFSCCDNLVFDQEDDLWVVTDISSGTLNKPGPLQYHANNALFFVPTSGPNAGIAFRFGNMPVEAEGTGPYFSPDERTLFLNVQHPGEVTSDPSSTIAYGDVVNYTSYWPAGDKTAGRNPSLPRPATVAITRPSRGRWPEGANLIPRPEGFEEHPSHGGRNGHRKHHSRRDFFKRG
jgi:uncharacterized protein